MKVFIIYAPVGSGHFKAAQAIYDYFKIKDQELESRLINILENSNFLFRTVYVGAYSLAIKYAPWLWSLGFYITYALPLRALIRRIRFIANRFNAKNAARLLVRENPDFIISTHFLPSEIAAHLKKQGRLTSKLITVITDFGVHPFWVCEGTDVYAVATDFTKRQLVLAGGKEECVKESGIPINPGFLKHYDKGAVRKALGLEQNKFTVLVITGSFGIGDIERIVELLHKDVQVLVVCARNLTLYKRLKNRNYPEVEVFGFVNNIPELMAASEVVITKPGGLTISELLAMELVPVFISEIPGQETTNANILEEYGVGIRVKKIEDLKDIILNFKENPERLNRLKENIRKIKKPFAVEELYNVVCQGSVGNTCRGAV